MIVAFASGVDRLDRPAAKTRTQSAKKTMPWPDCARPFPERSWFCGLACTDSWPDCEWGMAAFGGDSDARWPWLRRPPYATGPKVAMGLDIPCEPENRIQENLYIPPNDCGLFTIVT